MKHFFSLLLVTVLAGCSSERQTVQVTMTELGRCWNADVEVNQFIGGEKIGISPEKTIVGLSSEISCNDKPRQVMTLVRAQRGSNGMCISVVSRHLPPTGYDSRVLDTKETITLILPCPNRK